MLPILIIVYRYKPLVGCLTGVVYGLIQMLFGMSNFAYARYRYGMFKQEIRDGYQVEVPDNWLMNGNPFELRRPILMAVSV